MKDQIIITLEKVFYAGSLRQAIVDEAHSQEFDLADSTAMAGQTFATSGPGSGWTRKFTSIDYAQRILDDDYAESGNRDGKALDPDDGRIAMWAEDEIIWSDESIVELECPDVDGIREMHEIYEIEELIESSAEPRTESEVEARITTRATHARIEKNEKNRVEAATKAKTIALESMLDGLAYHLCDKNEWRMLGQQLTCMGEWGEKIEAVV